MTIQIDSDERFPEFNLVKNFGVSCEVPSEDVERWQHAIDEYNRVQAEMEAAYDTAVKAARKARSL